MNEPTIPPPDKDDVRISLVAMHSAWDGGAGGWDAEVLGVIRRCHAAESQLATIRDLLTPLLGTEVCENCEGRGAIGGPDDEPPLCPSCDGTGWVVIIADRIMVAGGPCKCVGGLNWRNPVKLSEPAK